MGADAPSRPPEEFRPQVRATSEAIASAVRVRARELGWMVAAHGSLERDLDLIAVPWLDEAVPEPELVSAVVETISSQFGQAYAPYKPGFKPHGRRAYTIHGHFGVVTPQGRYPWIDLSVMPLEVGE